MIDVCFLLLFFYILTSKPVKPEAGMSMTLPGTVPQEESIEIPDEQRIIIQEDGQVILNDPTIVPALLIPCAIVISASGTSNVVKSPLLLRRKPWRWLSFSVLASESAPRKTSQNRLILAPLSRRVTS